LAKDAARMQQGPNTNRSVITAFVGERLKMMNLTYRSVITAFVGERLKMMNLKQIGKLKVQS
jgi:hypothetical protein